MEASEESNDKLISPQLANDGCLVSCQYKLHKLRFRFKKNAWNNGKPRKIIIFCYILKHHQQKTSNGHLNSITIQLQVSMSILFLSITHHIVVHNCKHQC